MRKMIPYWWLLLGMTVGSSAAYAEDTIYMMAKLNIQGTTYNQVVFFSDPEITTVEACEKEILYGRTGQWQHFGHVVNKVAGMALSMNYVCRSVSHKFSRWQPRDRYDHIYEIDIRDGKLTLADHENYAACVTHFKQQRLEETYDHFCAKSNQTIVKQ